MTDDCKWWSRLILIYPPSQFGHIARYHLYSRLVSTYKHLWSDLSYCMIILVYITYQPPPQFGFTLRAVALKLEDLSTNCSQWFRWLVSMMTEWRWRWRGSFDLSKAISLLRWPVTAGLVLQQTATKKLIFGFEWKLFWWWNFLPLKNGFYWQF